MDRSLYISYTVLLDKRILAQNRRSLHILSYVLNTHHKIRLSLIERVTVGGLLSCHKFEGRNGETIHITHLLFADDTLVFCKDSNEQLTSLCWILLWFEAYFGLRINLDKSVILPMETVNNSDQLALELGCIVGTLPTTYQASP